MSEAVILMAYGSPATADDIRPYFEDIRGGRPVSDEAVAELAERYRRIGGRSPLDEHTEAQRAALERELGIPVFAGMKHWQPRIADAVERALDGGATRLIGVVLAPHFSRMSVGEYRERLEAALGGREAELLLVESWHDDPAFVDVIASRVRGRRVSASRVNSAWTCRPISRISVPSAVRIETRPSNVMSKPVIVRGRVDTASPQRRSRRPARPPRGRTPGLDREAPRPLDFPHIAPAAPPRSSAR